MGMVKVSKYTCDHCGAVKELSATDAYAPDIPESWGKVGLERWTDDEARRALVCSISCGIQWLNAQPPLTASRA